MKICLFTPTFLPRVGGTEYVTDQLARRFLAAGHEPVVLAQGHEPLPDLPYRVRSFAKPPFVRWFPESTARHLRRLYDEIRFDIVCCNYANPTGYGAVRLGKKLGVPVVVVSHGGDLYLTAGDRRRPAIWKRTQHTYRNADALIAISPYIDRLIREINPSPRRIELIPNGVDLSEYRRPSTRPTDYIDNRPFCLCLGNLGPLKGFDDAIEAYARVRDRLNGMAMVVVGDGPLERELRTRARDRGLERDVIFCGRRVGDDKRWFLQNCRFGLMPSIEEGHPIVGLEFLACGKPIVCSLNEAFDGMYEDGVNSRRVPARRSDLLAQAIDNMNGSDLEAMGRESLRRAAAYDWAAIAARYLSLFEELLTDRVAGPGRRRAPGVAASLTRA